MEPIYPPHEDEHPNPAAARRDAIVARVDELVLMDGLSPVAAARRALEENPQEPIETGSVKGGPNALAVAILIAMAVLVLAMLIPVLAWSVGHIIVPIWHWGFRWAS